MSYNQEEIELMAHLMRRAGFGAPRAELEERVDKGYEATVDELVDPDNYGFPQNDEDLLFRHFPVGILPGGVTDPGQGNYIWQILNTKRPLQEKMTLFWHHVFATGNSKIDNCDQMLDQINMFRTLALGNYRELLVALAKNPAMIFWLDNNENHKDRPNENWGRELLELFSMGQGKLHGEGCLRVLQGLHRLGPSPPSCPGSPTGGSPGPSSTAPTTMTTPRRSSWASVETSTAKTS